MDSNTDYMAQLHHWYQQPLGKAVKVAEQQVCAKIVPHLFGYHALQIGNDHTDYWLNGSPIKQKSYLSLLTQQRDSMVQGDPRELPFKTDSIDLICLPHSLENIQQPLHCIEESVRVLIPEGHLLILGFNRCSSWGLWRLLQRRRQAAPWNGHFVGLMQLRSCLLELDCEIVNIEHIFFRPPINHEKWLKRLFFLEKFGASCYAGGAGVYLLLARKKLITLTPIKPRWRQRKLLADKKLSGRTTRNPINEDS